MAGFVARRETSSPQHPDLRNQRWMPRARAVIDVSPNACLFCASLAHPFRDSPFPHFAGVSCTSFALLNARRKHINDIQELGRVLWVNIEASQGCLFTDKGSRNEMLDSGRPKCYLIKLSAVSQSEARRKPRRILEVTNESLKENWWDFSARAHQ